MERLSDLPLYALYFSYKEIPGHLTRLCDSFDTKEVFSVGEDAFGDQRHQNVPIKLWKAVGEAIKIQMYKTYGDRPPVNTSVLNDALRQVTELKRVPSYQLAVTGLERFCAGDLTVNELRDYELISELEESWDRLLLKATTICLILSARIQLALKQFEVCSDCLRLLFKKDPTNAKGQLLQTWSELFKFSYGGDDVSSNHVRLVMEQAAKSCNQEADMVAGELSIEWMFLQGCVMKALGEMRKSSDLFTQLHIDQPNLRICSLEKAEIHLMLLESDEAIDTLSKVEDLSFSMVMSQVLTLYHSVVFDTRVPSDTDFQIILNLLSDIETNNFMLSHRIGCFFGNLIPRQNAKSRDYVLKFIARAKEIYPHTATIQESFASELLYNGQSEKAMTMLDNIIQSDPTNSAVLLRSVQVSLALQKYEEAEAQFNLLEMLGDSVNNHLLFSLVSARLSRLVHNDFETAYSCLHNGYMHHRTQIKSTIQRVYENNQGIFINDGSILWNTYFSEPAILLDIAREALILPLRNDPEIHEISVGVSFARDLVGEIAQTFPRSLSVVQLLQYLDLTTGNYEQIVKTCCDIGKNNIELQIMSIRAKIYLGQHYEAEVMLSSMKRSAFDQKLSFILQQVSAELAASQGNWISAAKITNNIINNIEFKNMTRDHDNVLVLYDCMNIYSTQIQSLLELLEYAKAEDSIERCLELFTGTIFEPKFIIFKSESFSKRGEISKALNLLKKVNIQSPTYVQCLKATANIYLKLRKDENRFISCFLTYSEKEETLLSYVLLAEAYLEVKDFRNAFSSFKLALEKNPSDLKLRRRIAEVLVTNHQYKMAIDFFKEVLNSQSGIHQHCLMAWISLDFCDLLVRLRKYSAAVKEIKRAIDRLAGANVSVEELNFFNVHYLLLLNKAYESMGSVKLSLESINRARTLQEANISKLQSTSDIKSAKILLSQILSILGDHMNIHQNDFAKSISYYQQAIQLDSTNLDATEKLIELQLKTGNVENALILLSSVKLPSTTLALAKAYFVKGDLESASSSFEKARATDPTNLMVLKYLLQIYYSKGDIARCKQVFIEVFDSLKDHGKDTASPEVIYVKGYYLFISGSLAKAVGFFNQLRTHPVYGVKAIKRMAYIYASLDDIDINDANDGKDKATLLEHQRTLRHFMADLKSLGLNSEDPNIRFLHCCCLLVRKKSEEVQEAVELLVEIIQDHENSTGNVRRKFYEKALFFLSVSLVYLGEFAKGRNQLKRLLKLTNRGMSSRLVQQTSVLLSQLYVDCGSLDLAEEILIRVTKENGMNSKALEVLGLIKEKQGKLDKACQFYGRSLKAASGMNARVGFKYAKCLIRLNQFTTAVDVSQELIEKFPDYREVHDEIIHAAETLLRA